jgi:hypothetical protein
MVESPRGEEEGESDRFTVRTPRLKCPLYDKFLQSFVRYAKNQIMYMAIWPSGLRRWNQVLPYPVRKGVGSNPTVVNLFLHNATVTFGKNGNVRHQIGLSIIRKKAWVAHKGGQASDRKADNRLSLSFATISTLHNSNCSDAD